MMVGSWKISQLDDGTWVGEFGNRRTPKFAAYGTVKVYVRRLIAKKSGASKNLDKLYPA